MARKVPMERLGSDYLSASIKSAIVASVEEEMRINRIPGVSVAIVFDQDLIWDRGFGYSDAESKTAVTSDTIFAVGSITKLITATMLMQLRDAGKLNLDDPVQKYLPSLKIRSPGNDGRPVTLRQIASHTAGLPRELSFESWNTLEFPPVDKLLDELKDVTPVFPPLSRYKYSNLGYTILGQVLSVVAGVPYKQYAWENILKPLAMTSSGFALEDLPRQPATGYTVSGVSPVEKAPYLNFGALAPSVQLFSTAKDMSRFISLQFQEDLGTPAEFGKNAIALHPSTIREMHSPVYVGKRWVGGTAIGWHISRALGQTISSHRGGIPGFTADIALVRDLKFGVGVFTNAFPQPNEIAVRILEMLTPILASATTDSAQAEAGEEVAIEYEKYTGRYKSKYFGEVEIRIARGRLVMSDPLAPPGLEAILIPAGENRFVMSGGDEDGEFAVFDVTADGRVKSVNTAGYRYDR